MPTDYTLSELKKLFSEKGIEYFVSSSSGGIAEIRFIVRDRA